MKKFFDFLHDSKNTLKIALTKQTRPHPRRHDLRMRSNRAQLIRFRMSICGMHLQVVLRHQLKSSKQTYSCPSYSEDLGKYLHS